jgi:hypothetical protein
MVESSLPRWPVKIALPEVSIPCVTLLMTVNTPLLKARHNLLKSDCSFWFCPSSVFYVNLYEVPRAANWFWPWQTSPLEEMVHHLLQKQA